MSKQAKGTFTVKMTNNESCGVLGGTQLGRVSLMKTFEGDMLAQSTVDMLSAVSDVPGSAGYVAMEQVTATLDGKQGSFVLQHTGVREGESSSLLVRVVPGSGAAELKGIQGTLGIEIIDGVHFYSFDYSLPV